MSKLWTTIVTLKGTNQTIKPDIITYFQGIFQGDSLLVILFVSSVIPLSFMTINAYGVMQPEKTVKLTSHIFFC